MELQQNKENGLKTWVLQEHFLMKFEFPDFEVQENYVETGDNERIVHKITFKEQTSEPYMIGQNIDFPSSWKVNIKAGDSHAKVGLIFQSCFQNGEEVMNDRTKSAFCKFKISMVDKDGAILYAKNWRSWDTPRKIHLGEEYAMPNFINLEYLLENKEFLLQGQTLRLKCEGVLYSDLKHQLIQNKTEKESLYSSATQTSTKLWENMKFTDIVIIGKDGGSVEAHQFILSDASEAWANLLQAVYEARDVSNFGSHCLCLDGLTQSEIRKMLQFIYTGEIEQDWTNYSEVSRLIQISEEFELNSFKILCLKKLVGSMTLTSFPDVMLDFEKYLAERKFQEMLFSFFLKNQNTLLQLENFQRFAQQNKDVFLKVVLYDDYK